MSRTRELTIVIAPRVRRRKLHKSQRACHSKKEGTEDQMVYVMRVERERERARARESAKERARETARPGEGEGEISWGGGAKAWGV